MVFQLGGEFDQSVRPSDNFCNVVTWSFVCATIKSMSFRSNLMPQLVCDSPDISQWLPLLGYNYDGLVPDLQYTGTIGLSSAPTFALPGGYATSSSLMSVTSAFRCAFDRDMQQFSRLSLVSLSVVTDSCSDVSVESDEDDGGLVAGDNVPDPRTSPTRSKSVAVGRGIAVTPYIFGPGVVLDVEPSTGSVSVVTLDSAHRSVSLLVAVLLNGSTAVFPRSAGPHGRDILHFVRPSLDEAADDMRQLELRPEGTVRGLNVTVHRVHEAPGGAALRYVDVRLHGEHATITVRYGAAVASERARLLHHAWQRAVDAAWIVERELMQAGKMSVNVWSRAQAEALVSGSRINGYTGQYIRDVTSSAADGGGGGSDGPGSLADLADWPRNIRLVPAVK